ncbi:hypothetical protein LOK49_LG10G00763 [Camellia lanceoleosa]|uniref:Uncharacterized protein n=1 Tax=Camellia lanceoleosa TaxID=1840588 RepID=A0ACC0GA23_9ERIC|nr:hypothetical protein LOK49_LG10G00763 [Camellia lanceoleosa]
MPSLVVFVAFGKFASNLNVIGAFVPRIELRDFRQKRVWGVVIEPIPSGNRLWFDPSTCQDVDLVDFRMGINPGPPIMSREEFETRKADLWRKRAMESVAAKLIVNCVNASIRSCRLSQFLVYHMPFLCSAGAIAATFVCPLDVIKTRLQVHGLPEAHHSGPKGSIIITSLQNIIRTEGLKGLHRGLSPTLVALLPNWAVYFTVYGYLKDLLHTRVNNSGQLTFGANMIAASGAGAVTAIAANPLWVVKTRLQVGWILLSAVSFKLIEVD